MMVVAIVISVLCIYRLEDDQQGLKHLAICVPNVTKSLLLMERNY